MNHNRKSSLVVYSNDEQKYLKIIEFAFGPTLTFTSDLIANLMRRANCRPFMFVVSLDERND